MHNTNSSVYIIAEAGVNHNGRRDYAFDLIDVAADAGADAVKFQTFNAKRLANALVPKAHYQQAKTPSTESQQAMLAQLELPHAWHAPLQSHAHARGIDFLSTAFDEDSLNFLSSLSLPLYKVPSGELTNAPLLWQFAKTGKPLILSTGMSTLAEVEMALAVVTHALHSTTEPCSLQAVWQCWSDRDARAALMGRVTLLHCTSQYPTPALEVNLRAMDTLAAAFGLPVGYSDHTEGNVVSLAAVARGALVIEKHFTLDKTLPGPDHQASIDAAGLKQLVADVRLLEQALGDGVKVPQPSEWDTRNVARQSIVAARPLMAGQTMTRADLTTARTGGGMPPSRLWALVGRVCKNDYAVGDAIE